ncbi:aminoglycoside phosphotransferase family protein [Ruminiclostridium cellobioparum]|uniref:aminoglycoside phosphotransferase family protein n=1 Tax=Ruminiclostridium cellobioparum TaxID=29355 RepID=UPI0004825409|nr:aminoglycoside phosphotransferase family protein [Ruminiclostridium cellobioparum]
MVKGELIGSGATADVFDWTECTIIKIFNDYESDIAIEQEINNTKALQSCSFKYPKFIQRLEYEGKRAIIYEKIVGTSILKQIEANPISYKKYAEKLAHLHFEIHKNHVNGVKEQKQYFKERISYADDLTDDKKERLYKLIDNMPDGDCLCHSDFHPDNILSNENDDYIIDWADCCNGNPCADVARTLLTLKIAELPENVSIFTKTIITFIRNRFSNIYTKEYLKLSGKTIKQIAEWEVAVAAYRLCAAKKTEKSTVLKTINRYLEEVRT